jgi:hypothetical protein
MKETDIRISVLKELRKLNFGTSEYIANEFLESLNTDLGSIKRMLVELIDEGLIQESNIYEDNLTDSVIRKIDTKTINLDKDSQERIDKKSSKRLIERQGKFDRIPSIRIMITLKGINFLIENEKLGIDLTLSKWQRCWFWAVAFIAVCGLIISLISLFI